MTILVTHFVPLLIVIAAIGGLVGSFSHLYVLPHVLPTVDTPTQPHYTDTGHNEAQLFYRDTRDSFKMLNKRFDIFESQVGSLKDLFATFKRTSTDEIKQHCAFGSVVQGSWHENSGVWEWSSNNGHCKPQLAPETRTSCIMKHNRIVFLGDSQMYRLFHSVLSGMSLTTCENLKSGGRCGMLGGYMGIQELPHAEYHKPNYTLLEGPVGNGLSNPGCADCSGCDAKLYRCRDGTGRSIDLEYLPMEFVRDLELQSVVAGTTQENMLYYLSRDQSWHDSLVLLNAGIHDLVVIERLAGGDAEFDKVEAMTESEFISITQFASDMYHRNVMWLASLLVQHNVTNALFVATAALRQPRPHANAIIQAFNQRAFEAMALSQHGFLDTFTMLNSPNAQALYNDYVHASGAGGVYYDTVRDLVLRVTHCE